jgi:hypothetical protein
LLIDQASASRQRHSHFKFDELAQLGVAKAFFSKRGTARAFWYCYAVAGKFEISENNRVIGSSH